MYNELKERRRAVKRIAALGDKDFETVLFYLLGGDAEKETALKILDDCFKRQSCAPTHRK